MFQRRQAFIPCQHEIKHVDRKRDEQTPRRTKNDVFLELTNENR